MRRFHVNNYNITGVSIKYLTTHESLVIIIESLMQVYQVYKYSAQLFVTMTLQDIDST